MSDRTRVPFLRRPDIYVGLMFMGIAAGGLFIAKDYPLGTAIRMGTGYVPMLLCWALLGLGTLIFLKALVTGASEADALSGEDVAVLRPLIAVTSAVIAFSMLIEWMGLVIALCVTIVVGALASRSIRIVETLIAMVALTIVSWAVFGYALGLPFPIWPRL